MLSLPPKTKILSILAKISQKQKLNFSRSVPFHMKARICLKYFENDCRFYVDEIIKRMPNLAVLAGLKP